MFSGRPKRADIQSVGGSKGEKVLQLDDVAGFSSQHLMIDAVRLHPDPVQNQPRLR